MSKKMQYVNRNIKRAVDAIDKQSKMKRKKILQSLRQQGNRLAYNLKNIYNPS
jgi:hypothetical protein